MMTLVCLVAVCVTPTTMAQVDGRRIEPARCAITTVDAGDGRMVRRKRCTPERFLLRLFLCDEERCLHREAEVPWEMYWLPAGTWLEVPLAPRLI